MAELKTFPVTFVGAGPGDPDLITVAGRRALEEAELIVYAGSLVDPRMLDWARPESRKVDSAGLTLEEMVATMADGYHVGQKVVRLHTGDPSLYGAVREQFEALEKRGVPFRVIPGVTAAFAAASALRLEYTLPEVCQTLILTRISGRTPVPSDEDLSRLASHQTSMAIYLSAGRLEAVAETLRPAYGPEGAAAVVYRASWPDQKVVLTTVDGLADDAAAAGINKQAVILVGPALSGLTADGRRTRSRLYDPAYSHGFRRGAED